MAREPAERSQELRPQEIIARGIVVREEARLTRDRARELVDAVAADDNGRLLREVESLTEALGTRTIIANAVGLLMASGGVTRDEGFDQLRRASQRTNRKLREIAVEMVDRHETRVERNRHRGAGGPDDASEATEPAGPTDPHPTQR